jgi:hypothetical protein
MLAEKARRGNAAPESGVFGEQMRLFETWQTIAGNGKIRNE